MKPTSNKVLIKVDKPETRSKSGLYVTEEWKTLPPTGTVEATGPDVTLVVKGDRVLFERYGSVILEDEKRICLDKHILAVFDE